MGTKVKAICKCGINKEILIGGGMATYHDTDYFPCFCPECKDVVQSNLKKNMFDYSKFFDCDLKGNLLSEEMKNFKPEFVPIEKRVFSCPKNKTHTVIPYIDSRVIGNMGDREVARSFDNVLTNGEYKCPKCNEMTLKFLPMLYRWD